MGGGNQLKFFKAFLMAALNAACIADEKAVILNIQNSTDASDVAITALCYPPQKKCFTETQNLNLLVLLTKIRGTFKKNSLSFQQELTIFVGN